MSRNGVGEPPDSKKLFFPEGALLNQMEVAVVESERRLTEYLKEPYVVYLVESRPIENVVGFDPGCALWRRYSEFELLHEYLKISYPYVVMPPLPEKRIHIGKFQIAVDKFDPDFIERRRQGLECFLLRLASHPVFSQDGIFRGFLSQYDGWKESFAASHWKEKMNIRLKKISNVSIGAKKPDQRYEKIRSYCNSLSGNITALLKIQQRVSSKTATITKQQSKMADMFMEWSAIESELGETLKEAGVHLNKLVSQIDQTFTKEEVAYIDQLKEYLFFTESLRAIVVKQSAEQKRLEKAEENLSVKSKQKSELVKEMQLLESGEEVMTSGLKSLQGLIFGPETLETKQLKFLNLDDEVKEAESLVTSSERDANLFIEQSLKDLERFKKQKVRDIHEIMENYVKSQLKGSRIGLQHWQAVKDAVLKM